MAALRCEQLTYRFANHLNEREKNNDVNVIADIGVNNTTSTPSGASSIVFGPVSAKCTVLVRAYGVSYLVTKGAGAVSATDANSTAVDAGGFASFELKPGEALAAKTVTLA